jgi:predicted metal-dependent peptidase
MAVSNDKLRGYVKRLIKSRMRVLMSHGFYGLLLMHMGYSISEDIKTARTDGEKIIFSPSFLDSLSDKELDYVLLHEILHVVFEHYKKRSDYDAEVFDRAADIVVNSQILFENRFDLSSITIAGRGASPHLAPNGKEGYKYTVEEIYELIYDDSEKRSKEMLKELASSAAGGPGSNEDGDNNSKNGKGGSFWDEHDAWGKDENRYEELSDTWDKRIEDAARSVMGRSGSLKAGSVPSHIARKIRELSNPQTDWRTILNEFTQEEVTDFTFTPPDRRFDDSPFFLPDYNEKEDSIKDILFMIDTSGSMNDEMVSIVFSEVKGALSQFNEHLKGLLGFFDADVKPPVEFESVEDLLQIKPIGGGGTNFFNIFEFIKKRMKDNLPQSIVILTDGYAEFPEEGAALGVPVLWLICNDDATPPWGRLARIKI